MIVSFTGTLPALCIGGLLPRLEGLPLVSLGGPNPDDPGLTATRSRYAARLRPVFAWYVLYAGAVSLTGSSVAVALSAGAMPRWNEWPTVAVGWAVASFAIIGVPSGAIGLLGGRWQTRELRRVAADCATDHSP